LAHPFGSYIEAAGPLEIEEFNMPAASSEKTVERRLTVVKTTPPKAYHEPAWLVQCAWSEFRLPRLQELIRVTIRDLQTLPRPATIGSEPVSARPEGDPVVEALRACCEELRDASGMPGAAADRARHCLAVRGYMVHQPAAWADAFTQALEEYRRAATLALEIAFGRAVIT
jgi:hypothetical protein